MTRQLPRDLRTDVQIEVTRILPLLNNAGWNVEQIQWEANQDRANERRLYLIARSRTGKKVHLICPETTLPSRLTVLLTNTA